jgi:hypothetical protein
MTEEWRPVRGWEQHYEVSDRGRLRTVAGGFLLPWLNDQGYFMARLSSPRRMVRVHRLVAEAFVPNLENKPTINHIDCDRANNVPANLEWCTQAQNIQHAGRLGRMATYWRGKRSPSAKLSDDTVRAIRAAYDGGDESWASLGRRFGISKRAVGRLITGETYADV